MKLILLNSKKMNIPADSNHRYMAAMAGIYLIWTVIGAFMLRDSADQGVFYGRYLSRIIVGIFLMKLGTVFEIS